MALPGLALSPKDSSDHNARFYHCGPPPEWTVWKTYGKIIGAWPSAAGCRSGSRAHQNLNRTAVSRLLIIEDDAETADEVRQYFGARGYAVEWCTTGSDGLAAASNNGADVLIVDRLLPELDGLAVIGALRRIGIATPAIVLSALSSLDHRIAGLKAGGDDYLGKPFALAELEARVEALLRRKVVGGETVLRIGSLQLDLVRRVASRAERDIPLLPREFVLLEYMMRRAGQTVTRSMLFADVWGYRFTPNTNLVDVHVGKLRRKLHGPGEAEMLFNVRGIGFVLDEREA